MLMSAPTTPQPDPQSTSETPVPEQGNGVPSYEQVHLDAAPEAPIEEATKPGGSATEPESGGGYSG